MTSRGDSERGYRVVSSPNSAERRLHVLRRRCARQSQNVVDRKADAARHITKR